MVLFLKTTRKKNQKLFFATFFADFFCSLFVTEATATVFWSSQEESGLIDVMKGFGSRRCRNKLAPKTIHGES